MHLRALAVADYVSPQNPGVGLYVRSGRLLRWSVVHLPRWVWAGRSCRRARRKLRGRDDGDGNTLRVLLDFHGETPHRQGVTRNLCRGLLWCNRRQLLERRVSWILRRPRVLRGEIAEEMDRVWRRGDHRPLTASVCWSRILGGNVDN